MLRQAGGAVASHVLPGVGHEIAGAAVELIGEFLADRFKLVPFS